MNIYMCNVVQLRQPCALCVRVMFRFIQLQFLRH